MIATAILAGGMTMVAALFPVAIMQVESSTNDTIGHIICEEGLGMAKIRLRHSVVGATTTTKLTDFTGNFSSGDLTYPVGDANSPFGYVVLGQFAGTAGKNDYQLVIVSYRKFDMANTVSAECFRCPTVTLLENEDKCKITVLDADKGKLRVGSPLIVDDTGEYARITAVNGNEAVLDRQVGVIAWGSVVWTVIESGGAMKSPAWATMVTRTALTE